MATEQRKKGQKAKGMSKELAFLKKLYERKVDTRRSLHLLQQSSLDEVAKRSEEPEEYKPLPREVQRAMEKHHDTLKREQRQFSQEKHAYRYMFSFERRLPPLEEYWERARILAQRTAATRTRSWAWIQDSS